MWSYIKSAYAIMAAKHRAAYSQLKRFSNFMDDVFIFRPLSRISHLNAFLQIIAIVAYYLCLNIASPIIGLLFVITAPIWMPYAATWLVNKAYETLFSERIRKQKRTQEILQRTQEILQHCTIEDASARHDPHKKYQLNTIDRASDIDILKNQEDVDLLVKALENQSEVKFLDIMHKLAKEDYLRLFQALEPVTTLQNLILSKSTSLRAYSREMRARAAQPAVVIDEEVVSKLANLLQRNPNLRVLDLSYSEIGANSLQKLLNNKAAPLMNITTLNLRGTNINDADVGILVGALKTLPKLASLNLEANRIGDVGVKALAAELRDFRALKSLCLSYNLIGDEGAKHIMDSCALQKVSLDLQFNRNMTSDGRSKYLEFMQHNSFNGVLYLTAKDTDDVWGDSSSTYGCRIQSETYPLLSKSKAMAMKLSDRIKNNDTGNKQIEAVANLIKNNHILWLDISSSLIESNRYLDILIDAIQENDTLQFLKSKVVRSESVTDGAERIQNACMSSLKRRKDLMLILSQLSRGITTHRNDGSQDISQKITLPMDVIQNHVAPFLFGRGILSLKLKLVTCVYDERTYERTTLCLNL